MKITMVQSSSINTHITFVTEEQAQSILDFEAKAKSTTVRYDGDTTTIYVGLGSEAITGDLAQDATASALRVASSLKKESVTLMPLKGFEARSVEALLLANYRFDTYKTEKESVVSTVELTNCSLTEKELATAVAQAEAVCFARDLQNENAAVAIPEYLAQQARDIASQSDKIKLDILEEDAIQEQGLNLLWAVGQGSATLPRLIVMNYIGDPSSSERTAFVGKGITFDTGGMNLKPSGSMETMRMDMSGAAATLGVMKFLSETNAKINVVGVVPAAQSALGKDAYYVGDCYTSYSGKTVEVLNTDAEGRLVLADAISYTLKKYQPSKIFDMATLTGAILVALGDTMAGIFSNDKELAQELFEAGEQCGDRVWELPIREEHRTAMKSDIADLRNISKLGRKCGSITAAAFLENFVEETPWAHIDIAGTAWNDGEPKNIYSKYGTGFGVRLMLTYLLR